MSKKVPLRLSTAFGPSRDQAVLLAVHPEEEHDDYGKPLPTRRTLILSLKGNVATFREEPSMPLARSWYSAGSGVGYCTSVESNKLYKWQAGKWSEEVFSPTAITFVRFIFGFSGATPEEDQLFLTTPEGVFVRANGAWKRHAVTGQKFAHQIHGRDPSEVYIGGEPAFKWDGKRMQEVGGPDDGEITKALMVTSDELLVGGSRSMYITDANGDWQPLGVPAANYGNLMELNGVLFASSDKGLVQVRPPKRSFAKGSVKLGRLISVGDALIAMGESAAIVGDGTTWKDIKMPSCEVGKRPA